VNKSLGFSIPSPVAGLGPTHVVGQHRSTPARPARWFGGRFGQLVGLHRIVGGSPWLAGTSNNIYIYRELRSSNNYWKSQLTQHPFARQAHQMLRTTPTSCGAHLSLSCYFQSDLVSHPGFTLPLVIGPVTAVTGLTGLDRLRYRPVTNRGYLNFLDLNSKN
jgi:hypothetical protein